MTSSGIKLLILEDDSMLGESLKEGLSRQGHTVEWVMKPDEALEKLQSFKPDFILVDCLIPQMPGVDFVVKAQSQKTQPFKAILMSGIYTDRGFVQEAVQKTQAIAFLKKPFDLEEVGKLLKKDAAPPDSRLRQVYQIFSKEKFSMKEKKQLIESLDEITGYDLPVVFSLLAETKGSGYLNIYHSDGSTSGVTFSAGCIVSVDIQDKTTFLGEMLIQSGYITVEDLNNALAQQSKKKLGVRLIQDCLLSPHALNMVMTEQMNVRLSRIVTGDLIKVKFAASDTEMIEPCIDSDLLLIYLHDWVASKIPVAWLKALYSSWLGRKLEVTTHFTTEHAALKMSLIRTLDGLVGRLQKGTSFGELLHVPGYQETAVMKGLHFLLIKGLLHISTQTTFKTDQEQLQFLKMLQTQFQGQTPDQWAVSLGFDTSSNSKRTLESFIQSLGPQPKVKSSPIYKTWNELKLSAEKAFKNFSEGAAQRRTAPVTAADKAEAVLKANQIIEQLKKDLHYNHYAKAQEKLVQAKKLTENIYQYHLYNSWIKLGIYESTQKSALLKEVELEMMQVPPDERYDALYPFVTGLYLKATGDLRGARKSFEKALGLDNSFLVARREIGLLSTQIKPKQDIFNMDLKDVVNGFFKKSK